MTDKKPPQQSQISLKLNKEAKSLILERQKMINSIENIEQQMAKLNNHKLLKAYNSLPSMIAFLFVKGMAFGLGSVIGATLILSMVIFLLSQIEFIPIVGEWVKEILQEIRPHH